LSLLRFLMLLSLIVWLGGIIFFAMLAPTLFAVLPTRHLAGSVVAPMLGKLHWMGLASGLLFLASSMMASRLVTGAAHPFAARHVLVGLMLVLTLMSQFGISPKMAALRSSMGEIDSAPSNDPVRLDFNHLHGWSTRVEIAVLLLGLVVAYAIAQPFS
jgi:Domain of unknown function (DUF4149)